jgi:DNA polymerase III subunit chi
MSDEEVVSSSIYFVESDSGDQRASLCRWVERFYGEGKKVQILTDSTIAAQHLDQMLWTFSQSSFIPHRTVAAGMAGTFMEPVVITVGELKLEGFDVLVCDGPVELEFVRHYPLALHFVLMDDPEKKQASRLMWQRAKDQGFSLRHVSRSSDPSKPVGNG